MKVECLLEKFKNVVLQIEKVSGKNLSLPILSALYIQTDEKGLIIKATNLNIGAEIRIPAKVIEHGVVAVSAQLLAQIMGGMVGDLPITLETSNENLIISTKSSKMTLKSINTEDFPTLPKIEGDNSFELPIDQLILGIKSVNYAASHSDIKPEISSIFIYPEQENLVFVATDAFRLAEKKVSIKNIDQFPEILIPVKNINDIIRILAEYNGTITLTISENQLSFSNDFLYITSRLTNGTYPNYRQIIPKESTTQAIILKSDIQNILKSISAFSDKFNQIDVVINPQDKKYTFTASNNESGEGIISGEAALTGKKIETRMNQRYITDVLLAIPYDSLVFSFTEPNKPIIIQGVGDQSFTYLVMPMNR